MALTNLKWYRLSFKNTYWRFDSVDKNKCSEMCSLKSKELFSSGLKSMFPSETGLVEILSQMELKGEILKMNLLADSDILGQGISRCEFIFPKEVYIPTCHTLTTGMKEAEMDNRIVKLHDAVFISSGRITVGIAMLNSEMKCQLQKVDPKAFIGCMDINPFGLANLNPVTVKEASTK
ncbi:TPA_asm: M [Geum alphacytorhabdovirus 1]|nr:TPA_asm: M [Geum alphacytorhabdovirus 1]